MFERQALRLVGIEIQEPADFPYNQTAIKCHGITMGWINTTSGYTTGRHTWHIQKMHRKQICVGRDESANYRRFGIESDSEADIQDTKQEPRVRCLDHGLWLPWFRLPSRVKLWLRLRPLGKLEFGVIGAGWFPKARGGRPLCLGADVS